MFTILEQQTLVTAFRLEFLKLEHYAKSCVVRTFSMAIKI